MNKLLLVLVLGAAVAQADTFTHKKGQAAPIEGRLLGKATVDGREVFLVRGPAGLRRLPVSEWTRTETTPQKPEAKPPVVDPMLPVRREVQALGTLWRVSLESGRIYILRGGTAVDPGLMDIRYHVPAEKRWRTPVEGYVDLDGLARKITVVSSNPAVATVKPEPARVGGLMTNLTAKAVGRTTLTVRVEGPQATGPVDVVGLDLEVVEFPATVGETQHDVIGRLGVPTWTRQSEVKPNGWIVAGMERQPRRRSYWVQQWRWKAHPGAVLILQEKGDGLAVMGVGTQRRIANLPGEARRVEEELRWLQGR
jgi:hypothetical protein